MNGAVFSLCVTLLLHPVLTNLSRASVQQGIAPETLADYIHAVIEAVGTDHTIHVVERLQKGGGTRAAVPIPD